MPYGVGLPQEVASDDVALYEDEPQELTPQQKARLKHEQDLQAVQQFAGNNPRRHPDEFAEPSTQIREVVFDPTLDTEPLVGNFGVMMRYYLEKSSRCPSMDRADVKKSVRDAQDVFDSRGDQYDELRKQDLFTLILTQDMGISRTDRRATSDSGVNALSTISQKSDYRVTNNSPMPPPESIFSGLFKKKRQE